MSVAFPELRQDLIQLGEEDQAEIRAHYQTLKSLEAEEEKLELESQLKAHCHARAERMMEILNIIKEPSISNVGEEGSQVISLLALHSYLDEMKSVLVAFEKVYRQDPTNVYNEAIPSLTDRIMAFEHRVQLYGNNWRLDKEGKYFMIPVKDFEHMNERRAQFGLGPRMKPTVYAIGEEKYPLGQGLAEAADQKELTDEEYYDFTKGHIR
ncbi:MAG TPA: hypothetical protein VFN31_03755 [Candidatus Saccharimonadales bacterium]|nr:hypothetical protein [Candidatus Saccharimonadales bacterium]